MEFQSTRPVWGVTAFINGVLGHVSAISIHTPRVGRAIIILFAMFFCK